MSRESLIPCEICNAYVEFSQYANHLNRCLHTTRIAGFMMQQQRQQLEQQAPEDDEEDEDENESDSRHDQEIAFLSHHLSNNNQISRMTLHDFITDHFSGVRSPPTRNVVWFNITPSSSVSRAAVAAPAPDFWSRVEKGLTQEQFAEISYTTVDKHELAIQSDDICPVCQENLAQTQEVCKLACSHTYCASCIKTWLSKSKKCPVCMIDLEDAFLWGRS